MKVTDPNEFHVSRFGPHPARLDGACDGVLILQQFQLSDPIQLVWMVNQMSWRAWSHDRLHHPHEADGVGRGRFAVPLADHRSLDPDELDGGGDPHTWNLLGSGKLACPMAGEIRRLLKIFGVVVTDFETEAETLGAINPDGQAA